MKLSTGITALGPEAHPRTREQLLNEYLKPTEWWERPWVILLMMFLLSAADFANLNAIFSDILAQNPIFLIIFTGVLCLILNFLPIILARLLKLRRTKLAHVPLLCLILIPVVFAILIGVIWWIRFSTRDLEFFTNNLIQSIGGSGAQSQQPTSPAALPMVYILTFLPVCTSAVNFFLAWIGSDPVQQRINKFERHRLHLFENIVQLECAVKEYADGAGCQRLDEEDRVKYAAALNTVEAMRQYFQDYFRYRLAEHLGDPVSISALSMSRPSRTDNLKIIPQLAKSPAVMEVEK